jgi:hypothetical protein
VRWRLSQVLRIRSLERLILTASTVLPSRATALLSSRFAILEQGLVSAAGRTPG